MAVSKKSTHRFFFLNKNQKFWIMVDSLFQFLGVRNCDCDAIERSCFFLTRVRVILCKTTKVLYKDFSF